MSGRGFRAWLSTQSDSPALQPAAEHQPLMSTCRVTDSILSHNRFALKLGLESADASATAAAWQEPIGRQHQGVMAVVIARTEVSGESTNELRRRAAGDQAAGAVLSHLQRSSNRCAKHGITAAFGARAHPLASRAAADAELGQEADRVVHTLRHEHAEH